LPLDSEVCPGAAFCVGFRDIDFLGSHGRDDNRLIQEVFHQFPVIAVVFYVFDGDGVGGVHVPDGEHGRQVVGLALYALIYMGINGHVYFLSA